MSNEHDDDGIQYSSAVTVSEQREVVRRGRGRGRQRDVGRRLVAQRAHHVEAVPERRPRLRRVAPALL